MEFHHITVLLHETVEALAIRPDGLYVDGTVGGGGHSEQIARRLTDGRLIGLDQDETALRAARARLAPWEERVTLLHRNFRELGAALAELGADAADGMVFDLGVSSPQLDDASRGFSYLADAPLDMRMDSSARLTAWEAVNQWSEERLRRVLYDYGEERCAPRIAAAIVRRRERAPINTTLELADVVKGAMPPQALREKQHPAKRTFQALRIAVNDELSALETLMGEAAELLRPGGRLAVITFHSLEDRIVKSAMREAAKGCVCPPDFPVCVCGRTPKLKILTKKPILPSAAEIADNPRARSAKLRVAERVESTVVNLGAKRK